MFKSLKQSCAFIHYCTIDIGYRKDPVLTELSIKDYDQGSLKKLCDIYWIDVLFMNHIGYPSNCDQFL